MKAIRKSDGAIIKVVEWRGASDVVYSEPYKTHFYKQSDLDFNVEEESDDSDLRISVAKLREVLDKFINPQGIVHESVDNIIYKVKSEL